MRIAELSQQSGVPVPTIKYYLRENLLPPGQLTSRNQATYDEHHLRRLRLVRALIDIGQVPVANVKSILEALDTPDMSMHHRIGAVHRAVTPARLIPTNDSARDRADEQVRELIARRGWLVEPDAPAVTTLVETIAAMHALDQEHLTGNLDAYAEAVEKFTELEVAAVNVRRDADQVAESVVIGTVLGESAIAALRLLAQESAAARMMS